MQTPYMIRRHHTWYVRIRIPADLCPLLGSHVVRSLKTCDRLIANQRAIGLVSGFHGIWMEIRKKFADVILSVHQGKTEPTELRAFTNKHGDEIASLPDDVMSHFYRMLELTVQKATQDVHQGLERQDRLDALSMMLKDAKQKGIIEGMEKAMSFSPSPVQPLQPSASVQATRPDILWMDLIENFYKDNPGYSEATKKNYKTIFRDFETLIGKKNISEISKADLKNYADFLRDKPSKMKKNEENGALSHKTITKNLSGLKVFLAWCVRSDYLEDKGFNDIKPRAKTLEEKRQVQEDKRRAFTDKELTLFFDSPIFSGYKSTSSRSTPGYTKDRLPDFWFFVTMALTGARTEEICMAPSKLYDLDGVPCLDLRASGTKTQNSPRLIPILPQLQKVGFLNYAREQEPKGLKLIPYPNANVQDEADAWSKRLNRYIDDIGIDKDNLVCYSFRHNFRQMLRVSGINHEIVNKIFGHETGEVGSGYGSNLSKSEAVEFINKVKFPIDLMHLYVG